MRAEPERAGLTQSFVRDAVARDLAKRRTRPVDCLAKFDVIGNHRLRFKTHVSSTKNELTTSRWRLHEIVDGSALPQTAIQCMEDMLGGPRKIPAPDGVQFVNYDGPIYDDFVSEVTPRDGE